MHIPEAILHQLCTYVTVMVIIMNKDMLIVMLMTKYMSLLFS